ncbi:putative C-type lectin domain family 20 member A isoform X1, partial [Clarias magur]
FPGSTSMTEQRLFIFLFCTGLIPVILSVPRKYYLIQQERSWTDARVYCQATRTDLAIIESNDNLVQLQNEAKRQQFSSSAWIGLSNDVNSWRWSLGNEPLGSLTRWSTDEPNNNNGHEECGVLSMGGWWDVACTLPYPFVCFDESKTGNQRYIYISTTMTWHEAQGYCRQYHTDLASARDATENSVVEGLTSGWTWFGLFRDSWKWINQSNFSTISWMSGKPDNALKNENCGYYNNSQTVDAQCSDLKPFFCYSEITGIKQILRLKVQSNHGVSDAAIKTTIMEQ